MVISPKKVLLTSNNLPTIGQSDVLAHHVRGHDDGVDAELHQPRDKLGEGRDSGSPGK